MKHIVFTLAVLGLLASACQKEQLTVVETTMPEITERAPNECHNNMDENVVSIFEYCTGEFVMQGELRIVNVDDFHYIEGFVKCHKRGNPDAMVEVAELSVELNGELSIHCDIPITVDVPSMFNTNLVGGAVENFKSCNNCSSQLLRITYSKEVTLVENDDILKGKFRLKMDNCGDLFEEELDLIFVGD